MGKTLLRAAGSTGIALAVLLTSAAPHQITILELRPDNRLVYTPAGDTGTVTLSGPAPPGGIMIVLSSSNPEIVVPFTVTVPAGRTSATFPIRGASYNSRGGGDVTAMYGGTSKSIHLQIDPGSDVRNVSVDRAAVAGGSSITFRVEICGAAPEGGVSIPLFKSGPGQAFVSLPAAATVPAGQKTAEVSVAISAVQAETTVTLCANDPTETWAMSGCVGNSRKSSIVLSPTGEMSLKDVLAIGKYTRTFSSAAETGAGWGINFLVRIPYSVSTPVTVQLSSSHPAIAPIPPTLTIESRKTEGSVYFLTNAVSSTTTVTLTASLDGSHESLPVEVRKEAVVKTLSLSPESPDPNSMATGTVALDMPAPQGGTNVRLTTSDPKTATVPGSLLIAEGSTTGTFNIAVPAGADEKTVVIGAEFAGKRAAATLQVGQARISIGLKKNTISERKFSRADQASDILIGRWAGDFDRLSQDADFKKRAQGSKDREEYLAQAQARCHSLRLDVSKDAIDYRTAAGSELAGKYEILKDGAASVSIRVAAGTQKSISSRTPSTTREDSRTMLIVLSDRNHIRLRFGNGAWDYFKRVDGATEPRE